MKTALISVFDKSGIVDLANFLVKNDYNILSTGGTFKHLKNNNINVTEVSEYTEFPEILNGRVKTLNPKIYGGLLSIRNDELHQQQLDELHIRNIDLLVVNLYPFENVMNNNKDDIDKCIENIDIGGVCLLRAGSKNFKDVYVLSSPNQYNEYMNSINNLTNLTNVKLLEYRRKLSLDGFKATSRYDSMISNWLSNGDYVTRIYTIFKNIKYGCNPYQDNAKILFDNSDNFLENTNLPFEILNGNPGYINVLDALNAWALVYELKLSLNEPAAASFKHTSPAGVALSRPFITEEKEYYNVDDNISDISVAYLRARNSDPKSSFGDFISVNENVDITLAKIIKPLVTDGIIAPSFDKDAFELLKSKKKGGFIILKGNDNILSNKVEYREFKNCVLSQKSNNKIIKLDDINKIVTNNKDLSLDNKKDMVMNLITLKYTQSNSVGYSYNGQMIGIGAGQQSRIDCVRLARMKAETWFLRNHKKIKDLPFKTGVKKQDRVNAIIQYIEDDFTEVEYNKWLLNFTKNPDKFNTDEKREYLDKVSDVILGSDAFFPFRDSIDKASRIGVKYVVQPGGSIADSNVIEACNEYNMVMVTTNTRLFHH